MSEFSTLGETKKKDIEEMCVGIKNSKPHKLKTTSSHKFKFDIQID